MANSTADTASAKPKGQYSRPPNDFTGRKAEDLARERAEELAEREAELTMTGGLQRMEFEDSDEVEDLTQGPNGLIEPEPSALGDNVTAMEMVEKPNKIIRTNTDVEPVIGVHNHYVFKAGRKYEVPWHVYEWLEEKGLVYH